MAGNSPMYGKSKNRKVIFNSENWSKALRFFSCCGSRTYGLHRKDCHLHGVPYEKKEVPLPVSPASEFMPSDPENRNKGKMYEEYLTENRQRHMMRMRCAQKVSVFGIPTRALQTEEAPNGRSASYSMSSDSDVPLSTLEASTEEPSLDL